MALLKRIPLGPNMLSAIRERGDQLRNGTMRCRGDALLPLSLASYIFDALCMPGSHQWLQVIPGLLLNHGLCCRLFVCCKAGGAGGILIFCHEAGFTRLGMNVCRQSKALSCQNFGEHYCSPRILKESSQANDEHVELAK